jgi:hypothetical protein
MWENNERLSSMRAASGNQFATTSTPPLYALALLCFCLSPTHLQPGPLDQRTWRNPLPAGNPLSGIAYLIKGTSEGTTVGIETTSLLSKRDFHRTILAVGIGAALPGALPLAPSGRSATVQERFQGFTQKVAATSPFKENASFQSSTLEEAQQKTSAIISLFRNLEHSLFPDFNDFLKKLTALLPQEDKAVKDIQMKIPQGTVSQEDIDALYVKVRDYLAANRIVIIFKAPRAFPGKVRYQQTKLIHYLLRDEIFFVERTVSPGIPVVRPWPLSKAAQDLAETKIACTISGIPFIISSPLQEYISTVERWKTRREIKEAAATARFDEFLFNQFMRASTIRLDFAACMYLARRFASGRLAKEENIPEEATALIASHEYQHAQDFIQGKEYTRSKGEMRAHIAALRHAWREALRGYCAARETTDPADADPSIRDELFWQIITLIKNNSRLAGIITPNASLQKMLKENFKLDDGESESITIASQLDIFAQPEHADELAILIQKLSEESETGAPLSTEEPKKRSSAEAIAPAAAAALRSVAPSPAIITNPRRGE